MWLKEDMLTGVMMVILLSLALMKNHILSLLLLLELMTLTVFFSLSLSLSEMECTYFLMGALILGACEGVLGLSILVLFARSSGNDLFF